LTWRFPPSRHAGPRPPAAPHPMWPPERRSEASSPGRDLKVRRRRVSSAEPPAGIAAGLTTKALSCSPTRQPAPDPPSGLPDSRFTAKRPHADPPPASSPRLMSTRSSRSGCAVSRPATGDRRPATGDRRPATGDRNTLSGRNDLTKGPPPVPLPRPRRRREAAGRLPRRSGSVSRTGEAAYTFGNPSATIRGATSKRPGSVWRRGRERGPRRPAAARRAPAS